MRLPGAAADKRRAFSMATLLLTAPLDVFEQMALDETLAHSAPAEPILRFYHWKPGPAVTFGYGQFYDFVRRGAPDGSGPLCRRPTGGGMVFHGEDLTFSLMFSTDKSPKEIYALLHEAVRSALAREHAVFAYGQQAVSAAAYAPQRNGAASACFVSPVENDLLAEGKKILGGAIRRFGKTALYQGSLQYPGARENPAFRRAVKNAVQEMLGACFVPTVLDRQRLASARKLAEEQYRTDGWNHKF